MKKTILIITAFLSASIAFSQDATISLEQAVNYAIANNFKHQQNLLDIEIAKKKVWETTAIGLPQVTGEAQLQRFLDIPVNLAPAQAFNPAAPEDEFVELQFGLNYNNSYGITASQLLFDGSYIVGLQAAKTYKNLSIVNGSKSEIELREAVTQAYYTVLVAQENTEVLKKSRETVEKILTETKALHKVGLTDEQSVDQLSLSFNEIKTAQGIASGQVRFAKKLLNIQMGVPLDSAIGLADNLENFVLNIKSKAVEEDFNINNHIDFQLAETNLKLSQLNLRKEKFSFLPSVNLFFNHQKQNMSNDFDAFSGGRWFPSSVVGAQLRLPILTSGSRLAKMGQARVEYDKTKLQLQEIEQGLSYQNQLAISNHETNYEKYKNQQENMDLSKRIYEKAIKQYQEGVITSLELSQIQNQFLTTEGQYISALLDVLKSSSEVKKSYGK